MQCGVGSWGQGYLRPVMLFELRYVKVVCGNEDIHAWVYTWV